MVSLYLMNQDNMRLVKISFSHLINKASESLKYNGQVIFATSLEKDELFKSCEGKDVNLVYFEDYILKLKQE